MTRGAVVARVAVAAFVAAVVLGLAADLIAAGEAVGHVRYHAIQAAVVAAIATALAARSARRAAVSWAAIGLLALVLAQLVEGVGGAGFDERNEGRNGLAVLHDLGIGLTSLGLLAAVAGIGLGGWRTLRGPLGPRWAAVVAGAVTLGGFVFVKTIVGL